MLQVILRRQTGNDSTVFAELIIRTVGGSRVCRYTILGRDGAIIREENIPDGSLFVTRVIEIRRDNLPVIVVAHECPNQMGNESSPTTIGPLLAEEATGPSARVICNPISTIVESMPNVDNENCRDLRAQIQSLRNNVISKCGRIRLLRENRNHELSKAGPLGVIGGGVAAVSATIIGALIAAAAKLLGTTIAAATAAAFSGPWGWIAAALLAIGVIIIAVALYHLRRAADIQGEIEALEIELGREEEQLRNSINRLPNVCCPEFFPPQVDIPTCS